MNLSPEILDRVPPCDHEAEQRLLSAVLLLPKCLDGVAEIINADDFRDPRHQTLYRVMLAMDAENITIDPGLLVDRLRRGGRLEAAGGQEYLIEVFKSEPLAENWRHYSEIVSRLAKMRSIITLSLESLRDAYDQTADPKEIVDQMEKGLSAITLRGSMSLKLIDAQTMTIAAMTRMDELAARGDECGLFTGIRPFDELTGGFFPGEFIVLSARSGIGKTSLVCQMLAHNACRKRMTYMASLEMDAAELGIKMLCTAAMVDGRKIRTNRLADKDREDISTAASELAASYLRIDDRELIKVSDIRRATRKLIKDGLRFAIVDYLQIVTPGGEDNREQQIAGMSRQFKALARELKIPVIVLCQSNRDAEKDKTASLRHLRESDAIGHNADVVIMLETGAVGTDKSTEAFLTIAKNRNGPKGKIPLRWHPQFTLFTGVDDAIQSPIDHRPANRNTEFDGYDF